MRRDAVDNLELIRWRQIDAIDVLHSLAEYVKADPDFVPRTSARSTRWHASVDGHDFELLCTGPKFFDTRAGIGGGGAIDLVMHVRKLRFKQTLNLLRAKGL